ncbi:MAG: hypothetical protein HQL05_08085 [Nitrospirae bacterium]|uniref:hypothetical protein n=1 Tax=Candidatus Magnetobacterium casense TaxID=1455061 RepID=UPI0012DFD45F|nr:hypothetical protein [Candidatus Magnetobacterium casensis]MBF0337778.1 hypothetical protein [Nitrospirota bacterium]
MKKKIDSVAIMRQIRAKLSEKYARSHEEELSELKSKFGHLRRQAEPDTSPDRTFSQP